MAEVYLLVAIHFVIVVAICGTFGYYFHKMYVENKIAEAELRACEYRTTHMTAEALKEIINR
jgi:hypothetical protein